MSRAARNSAPELDDVATGASGNVSARSCPSPTTAHNASAQPANPNRIAPTLITLHTNRPPIGWVRPSIFSHSASPRRSAFSFWGRGTIYRALFARRPRDLGNLAPLVSIGASTPASSLSSSIRTLRTGSFSHPRYNTPAPMPERVRLNFMNGDKKRTKFNLTR